MTVTTKDIAEACGVSRGTVDRALNDRPGINPETKKQVLQMAEKMGYRPHLLARSLVKGKTMSIGVIVFDLNNRFFSQLINNIEFKAREQGYFVYLTLTNKDKEIEKECINHLQNRRVDGLIMCPINKGQKYQSYLKDLNMPVVTVGNKISNDFSYVGINDKKAMFAAVKHIIKQDYREIIYVSPPLAKMEDENIYAQEQRFKGFKAGVEDLERNIKVKIIKNKKYIAELAKLNSNRNKTAILCSSDVFALDVLKYLKSKNIRVPADIGLIGFDKIDMLEYVEPSLTTVSYPVKKIGITAVEQLVEQIEDNNKTEERIIDYKIVRGKSL